MNTERIGPDGRYHTRLLGAPDLRALQTLFESAGDYFEIATGQPAGPDEAPRAFVAGPPTKAVDAKRIIGIFDGRELVGVLDAITDWPEEQEWTMGMLLLAPRHRGRGVGSTVLAAYEAWAASEGAVRFRTAVVARHAMGVRFLERRGYRRLAGPVSERAGGLPSAVLHFTKAARPGAPEGKPGVFRGE